MESSDMVNLKSVIGNQQMDNRCLHTHCSLKPNRPQVSHKCFQTVQATISLGKSHMSFQFKQSEVPKEGPIRFLL